MISSLPCHTVLRGRGCRGRVALFRGYDTSPQLLVLQGFVQGVCESPRGEQVLELEAILVEMFSQETSVRRCQTKGLGTCTHWE